MSRCPILLALVACAPGSYAVPAEVGVLVVDAELEIGPVALDRVGRAELTISNAGAASLDLALSLQGDGFSLDDGGLASTLALAAGADHALGLRFTPADGQPRDGALTLGLDPDQVFADAREPVTVALLGTPDPDADQDGHDHALAGGDDCDDRDPDAYPGAEEIWYDGVDQDCDGRDDDQDEDGYGALEDCDDEDPARNPEVGDATLDGIDDDCDGAVDEDGVRALVGSVIFSELLADSVVASGGDAGWIELASVAEEPLDLSGWRLGDEAIAGTLDGAATLEPGGLLLVCANGDPLRNGGISCDATLEPWPDLREGPLALLAPIQSDRGVELERVSIDDIDPNPLWDFAEGQSTQLDPASWSASENDDHHAWCLSAGSPEDADVHSAGAANAGC